VALGFELKLGGDIMRKSLILALAIGGLFVAAPATKAQVGGSPYLGEILLVPYNFAPRGWAFCQGQILPIEQNTALFSLLGTTYGGDGIQTFALPDLRGRSPISSGQGPGLQNYDLGQTGGEEAVTLSISQIPSHTHPVVGSTNVANLAGPSGAVWATQSLLNIYSNYSSDFNTSMAAGAVSMTGNGQPHDNRSPYLTLNYIIALQGIYPSRN
jgi:microcystin-dependent protein